MGKNKKQKTDAYINCVTRDPPQNERHRQTENKGMNKRHFM